MPITDEIKKTLSDPTPLYALAGAGDLAYEKLREVPGKVEALAGDRKGTQEKAAARLQEAQARLVEAQAKVTESVTTLPTDFKVLQEKAQGFALQQVGRAAELAVKAKEVYDELAVRGKAVVDKASGADEPSADVSVVPVFTEQAVEAEIVEIVAIEDEPAAEKSAVGEPAAEASPAPAKKTTRARKTTTAK
ncbi:hypothetical protein GCM10010193_31080 [Kitasatospora atroaurantiaca]|uniref:Heparin binding hemagglutinin HbhA n=1 Tax=Kitasatospora atroaurantiaca TaxID=285545 RepID=A0A561ER64_9ACTN|nr:hypothetical protein [Kitasatospora atroaurantiaca]TWE18095.1 hypothetical protein FB465_3144 [Kitasatospora atroaurantiaca]